MLLLMHYSDNPEPKTYPPGAEDKVMHATVRIGNATLMFSDGGYEGETEFSGFSLSLSPANEEEAEQVFAALSKGGEVQMPLSKTFWSPCFGKVTDCFGISWMLNVLEQ